MRAPVDNKSQMKMVFGTVKETIWGGKWQILFHNDRYIRLLSKEFEVVTNDYTQIQCDVNSRNDSN